MTETKAGEWWFFRKENGSIMVGRICKLIINENGEIVLAAIVEDDSEIGFTPRFVVVNEINLTDKITLEEDQILYVLAWKYLNALSKKLRTIDFSIEKESAILQDFENKIKEALEQFQ